MIEFAIRKPLSVVRIVDADEHQARCYMCNLPGTTVEHVPPRALFPESRDFDGENFRKNLITVPSCPLHNNAKSDDDEFLMVSLAGIVGNNSIGYRQHLTKVSRALRRSSNRLLEEVLTKRIPVKIALGMNRFFESILGTPDVARLRSCFDRIVRGLHLHHFKRPLIGTVNAMLGGLFHTDQSAKNFAAFMAHRAAIDLAGLPRFGSNQKVFYYRVTEPDSGGLYLFHLCFYGGVDVYAAVQPDGVTPPFNLGIALMNSGIKTILTLDDKSYEIN